MPPNPRSARVVFSAYGPASLLHLATSPGVAVVAALRALSRVFAALSRLLGTALRRSPLEPSRTASPRPAPSSPLVLLRSAFASGPVSSSSASCSARLSLDLEVLLSSRVRSPRRPFPVSEDPLLPWVYGPLRGFHRLRRRSSAPSFARAFARHSARDLGQLALPSVPHWASMCGWRVLGRAHAVARGDKLGAVLLVLFLAPSSRLFLAAAWGQRRGRKSSDQGP